MDLGGEVNGALSVHWVPSRRVGRAEELGFQPYPYGCFFDGGADDAGRGFPRGPAGRSAHNPDSGDFSVGHFHGELGSAEPVSVMAQAVLPGKAASGGGR